MWRVCEPIYFESLPNTIKNTKGATMSVLKEINRESSVTLIFSDKITLKIIKRAIESIKDKRTYHFHHTNDMINIGDVALFIEIDLYDPLTIEVFFPLRNVKTINLRFIEGSFVVTKRKRLFEEWNLLQ